MINCFDSMLIMAMPVAIAFSPSSGFIGAASILAASLAVRSRAS